MEDPLLVEVGEHTGGVLGAEAFSSLERDLERAALELVDENVKVVRVDQTRFGRSAEHVVGVLHDVLIDR